MKKEKMNILDKKQGGLIKGTIILTIAGFMTRLIGFFYRIFLSNKMGAENLGIYQLIFPIYGISFAIYAVGIQTSISRLVASAIGSNNEKKTRDILRLGIFLSLSLSILISCFIYYNSNYIAWRFLFEKRSSLSLKILVIAFPFCSITSCINGYYYGMKKAFVPASTQLLEQIIRVLTVYFFSILLSGNNQRLSCELGVFGIVIGELFSSLYNISSLFYKKSMYYIPNKANTSPYKKRLILKELLKSSIPLSSNRLLINVLSSIEVVLIPSMLKKSGLSTEDSLSIFGVLNGMSIPFILFPSTIANSFAVMLLPLISEAKASYNNKLISNATSITMKYSVIIGILSTGIFFTFGNKLGMEVFNNKLAGEFLRMLSLLCPFIYMATTTNSIINGLGKTHITFINALVGVFIRILFTILLVPHKGIEGYLTGLLVSQFIISSLDIFVLNKYTKISFSVYEWIISPSFIMVVSGYVAYKVFNYLCLFLSFSRLLILLLILIVICITFVSLLLLTKTISISEAQKYL